jgi:hypothetical protein
MGHGEDAAPKTPAKQKPEQLNLMANARQVGGNHYRKGAGVLQHWDVVALFNLDYFQGNISKYTFRWRDKAGIQDLNKARHYLDKYIEIETARANGTLTRSILERAILELEEIEQQDDYASALRAQNNGDFPVDDVLSGYKFNVMPDESSAVARKDRCTHGADDCPVHPNGGCPAAPGSGAAPGSLPAGAAGAAG